MSFILNFRVFALVAAVFLAFGGTAQAKDDFYELSMATMYSPGQTQYKEIFQGFAKEVEKRTDGSVVINVFGVGTIVPSYEEGHGVKSGNVDMGPLINLARKEQPYLGLFVLLPDMSESIEDTVNLGPLLYANIPELKKETDNFGVPIGFTSFMPYAIISNNELITSPEDLVGKRMLVQGGAQSIQAEAWGAIPVMVGMSDLYIGLQRGMGEAALSGLAYIKGAKLYETAKYITILNFPSTNYMPIIANKELFAELSENQQNIILETADEYFGEIWLDSWNSEYDIALKTFTDAGCEVYFPSEEELLVWKEANKAIIPVGIERAISDGLTEEQALDFIDRVYDTVEASGVNVSRYTGS